MRSPLRFVTMPSRRAKLYPTPEDAETAFYEAFERSDLAGMMAVWAEADDIVCIHPQGPRLTGFEAVRESWAQIFAGGTSRLRLQTTEVRKFSAQGVAVHSVVEVLSLPNQQGPTQSVCATNVYELTENGWRMVVHHASPLSEPAAPTVDDAPPSHTLH
jgi:ketosteroid isomerase-like protein